MALLNNWYELLITLHLSLEQDLNQFMFKSDLLKTQKQQNLKPRKLTVVFLWPKSAARDFKSDNLHSVRWNNSGNAETKAY